MMAALVDETVPTFNANTVDPKMPYPPSAPWYDQESDAEEALHLVASDDWHDDFDDDFDDDDDDDFFPDDDEDLLDDVDVVDDDF